MARSLSHLTDSLGLFTPAPWNIPEQKRLGRRESLIAIRRPCGASPGHRVIQLIRALVSIKYDLHALFRNQTIYADMLRFKVPLVSVFGKEKSHLKVDITIHLRAYPVQKLCLYPFWRAGQQRGIRITSSGSPQPSRFRHCCAIAFNHLALVRVIKTRHKSRSIATWAFWKRCSGH